MLLGANMYRAILLAISLCICLASPGVAQQPGEPDVAKPDNEPAAAQTEQGIQEEKVPVAPEEESRIKVPFGDELTQTFAFTWWSDPLAMKRDCGLAMFDRLETDNPRIVRLQQERHQVSWRMAYQFDTSEENLGLKEAVAILKTPNGIEPALFIEQMRVALKAAAEHHKVLTSATSLLKDAATCYEDGVECPRKLSPGSGSTRAMWLAACSSEQGPCEGFIHLLPNSKPAPPKQVPDEQE
jgi:hypothetical protein